MKRLNRLVLTLFALVLALGLSWRPSTGVHLFPQVQAAGLDLDFRAFYDPDRKVDERTKSGSYKSLMKEVSLAMGSRMVGPAASLGALGVEIAYELSFVGTNSNASYWQDTASAPAATISTGQLRVRKGMPYGLQFGANLTHMYDSNMWAIGAEMKIAMIDGYKNIPDLAMRTSINVVLGNADLGMLIAGADFILSKSFGIAGVASLQPWAAYSFAFTHVSTHQIDVYPTEATIQPDLMLLKQLNESSHRIAFGLRVVVTRVSVGFEFLRSFTDDQNVMTGKIGVDF
ncbi:MAG TPA: hypothetical protein DCQ06_00580 [Myxococcales bacterium]|nr:hypothetical protein [Myxococcales bacterium]HAN30067.1 hypothetical protein [Myxococcales bacterium]